VSTAGPNYPGTMADESGIGTIAWASPDYAKTNNGTDTSFDAGSLTRTSHYLKATNFGFTIPSGATINGVSVSVETWTSNYGWDKYCRTSTIKLVKGGTISGSNQGNATDWTDSFPGTVLTYGGASELWGLTLTDTDINSSTFGVALSATIENTTGKATMIAYVDYISITITYTEGAAGVPKQMMHYAKMRKTR